MAIEITRKAYMPKLISHSQFFGHIANKCNEFTFPEKFMERVVTALVTGDEHLSTIPLQEWDNMVNSFSPHTKAIISKYDGGFSLASGVCMLKEKARLQAGKENVIGLYKIVEGDDYSSIESYDSEMLNFVAIALNVKQPQKFVLFFETKDLVKTKQFVELWYETKKEQQSVG
jgi:hypothetical protein